MFIRCGIGNTSLVVMLLRFRPLQLCSEASSVDFFVAEITLSYPFVQLRTAS